MLAKVLEAGFKEDQTAPFLLTYQHSKEGGSTEIDLSVFINWTDRTKLVHDKEAVAAIKKGLGAIISRSGNYDLIGLAVDQAFKKGNWSIKPFEG